MVFRYRNANRQAGQNLAELALVLPFLVILVFGIIEFGRAWQAFFATKLAAIDGAHTASITRNPANGQAQCQQRLASAQLTGNCSVSSPDQNKSFQAEANSQFVPLFAGLQLRFVGGATFTLIPRAVPIRFSEQTYSVYL